MRGNCVWLPYSDHTKTTWNIRKWCSTNTVHMCNTFMNLTTYYVRLSLISAAIKQLILPCFVQHEGCSYLKIVACRSGWACSSSIEQLHLTLTYTHFLLVYTVLTCSVFIWLMKCSSSNCSWHYVYTASHSIHSINLKYVHLAHEILHLKDKLVLKCGCGE